MYERERKEMVESLISSGHLSDKQVIKAMLKVNRHMFLPSSVKIYAYRDQPLQVGEGQTISAPHMVAMMCELLDLKEGLKVLEVGGGTGYHACVVSEIVKSKVYSIESKIRLIERARESMELAGCTNVELVEGDGTEGYEKEAPYDRIFVTAGAPDIPQPLVKQLKRGGRLLIPVGPGYMQNLVQVDKGAGGKIKETTLSGCTFVPLVGRHGW